jgi:hypothetical protein
MIAKFEKENSNQLFDCRCIPVSIPKYFGQSTSDRGLSVNELRNKVIDQVKKATLYKKQKMKHDDKRLF